MRPLTRLALSWLVPFIPLTLAARCDAPGCGSTPPEMERSLVEGTVYAGESTVTYSDGTTRIGVIFKDEHRQPVRWDDLPPPWVVAIVAAEDGRYWSHSGVDATSVARAARDNLEAGTVVSGGSTLTQQTAKNLFDRPDRSLDSKLSELDQALHLEKVYSKREILTFYANLFYVTGNGVGLGIAARYFFDKLPSELTVLESAYIAGLVKGPSNYDPFIGTADKQAAAKERAVERTRYVLERIVAESLDNLVPKEGDGKAITSADVEKIRTEAKALLAKGFDLPFRKGIFRYDSSTLLDEVKRRLEEPTFQAVLADAEVGPLETAGLTVVTTLDVAAQHEATYGLVHHLSDLGVMLEAKTAEVFIIPDGTPPSAGKPPIKHELRTAVVTGHVDEGGKSLTADLGGFPCALDRDAMIRGSGSVYRGKVQDRYAKVPTVDVDAFADAIPDGSVVWVSVREPAGSGPARCDLETRPELQGASVVAEDGQIRAMVGGTLGKDFNRVTAPRQMGSTFKSLIYHSAMTLGWQADDVLDNRRGVFPFSGTFYLPNPDHEPKDWVSMAWAGVNSENLASIWLLYHLTDPLSHSEFAKIAETVGLAKAEGESDDAYKDRIQKAGVLSTAGRIPEGQFFSARREVSAALVSGGHMEEARELQSMHYGWGFDSARSKAGSSDKPRYDSNWLRLQPLMTSCAAQYDTLERALASGNIGAGISSLALRVSGNEVLVACGTEPEGYLSPSAALSGRDVSPSEGEQGDPGDPGEPSPAPEGKAGKGKAGKAGKTGKGKAKANTAPAPSAQIRIQSSSNLRLADKSEMIIDNLLRYGTMTDITSAMERQKLVYDAAKPGLYDPEVLYRHSDFRLLLGMRYVTWLAQQYGVKTDLAEVMSLPLGASEITIEEAAAIYEGVTSGERWSDPIATADPLLLIAEIRDQKGEVIYKADPQPVALVSPSNGQMMADILRNVVQYGTGKGAKDLATAGSAGIPLGGKTGTTNDFKNVAFIGYLPGAVPGGYAASAGWTVAVYVGYDDNRPMKAGKISIAGSSGALPTWILTVQGLLAANPPKQPSGATAVASYWPLAHGQDVIVRNVSSSDGLPSEEGGATVLTRLARAAPEGPVAAAPSRGGKKSAKKKRKSWWSLW